MANTDPVLAEEGGPPILVDSLNDRVVLDTSVAAVWLTWFSRAIVALGIVWMVTLLVAWNSFVCVSCGLGLVARWTYPGSWAFGSVAVGIAAVGLVLFLFQVQLPTAIVIDSTGVEWVLSPGRSRRTNWADWGMRVRIYPHSRFPLDDHKQIFNVARPGKTFQRMIAGRLTSEQASTLIAAASAHGLKVAQPQRASWPARYRPIVIQ